MPSDESQFVEVRLTLRVQVDPKDDTLIETFRDSDGTLSVADVVRAEVESNLNSVSYVRDVNVEQLEEMMVVRITPNDNGNPPGKLADAELHFTEGPLEGLRLIGFAIWERRGASGRNVTFPARNYSVNGERRSYALLRPTVDTAAQNKIRDLVLEAYAEFDEGGGV